ncbi:MAG: hypothetical protein HQL23_07120 [Candidatus Omnitrophica bacterium]|nr:hypothetical protein [Candidatus Omnitrophota bacterium]
MNSIDIIFRRGTAASILVLALFCVQVIAPEHFVYGQGAGRAGFVLPAAGSRVELSPAFVPPLLKGIKVYADNPLRVDFILDSGDVGAPLVGATTTAKQSQNLEQTSHLLIKYFLAALTVPEKDLWVNLSPYEKNRVIPEAFGVTDLGRDILALDYLLKQLTASLLDPATPTGKEFWDKVYAEAQKRYGTTDIPVDTFNKVWIVPAKSVVYENSAPRVGEATAFIVESQLKVMLEQDYNAQRAVVSNGNDVGAPLVGARYCGAVPTTGAHEGRPYTRGETSVAPARRMDNAIATRITREVVIPAIEKEVNEGRNFAPLRQAVHSFILAAWYKRKLKDSILGQSYVDQRKTPGIEIPDKTDKDKIYRQYIEAFKQGVANSIKEEYDPVTEETVTRKYFSGGVALSSSPIFYSSGRIFPAANGKYFQVQAEFGLPPKTSSSPAAMSAEEVFQIVTSPKSSPHQMGVALAGLVRDRPDVRKRLDAIRRNLSDFHVNMMYHISINNTPVMTIELGQEVIFSIMGKTEIYPFRDFDPENDDKVTLAEFFNLKLTGWHGETILMRELLRTKNLLRFFENGLPLESSGHLSFDATGDVTVLEDHQGDIVWSAQIDLDERGGLRSSTIGPRFNAASIFEDQKASEILSFHFHSHKDLRPSWLDMEFMVRQNRPELIIDSDGKGTIWLIKDIDQARQMVAGGNWDWIKKYGDDAILDGIVEKCFSSFEIDLNDAGPSAAASPLTVEQADSVRQTLQVLQEEARTMQAEIALAGMEGLKEELLTWVERNRDKDDQWWVEHPEEKESLYSLISRIIGKMRQILFDLKRRERAISALSVEFDQTGNLLTKQSENFWGPSYDLVDKWVKTLVILEMGSDNLKDRIMMEGAGENYFDNAKKIADYFIIRFPAYSRMLTDILAPDSIDRSVVYEGGEKLGLPEKIYTRFLLPVVDQGLHRSAIAGSPVADAKANGGVDLTKDGFQIKGAVGPGGAFRFHPAARVDIQGLTPRVLGVRLLKETLTEFLGAGR